VFANNIQNTAIKVQKLARTTNNRIIDEEQKGCSKGASGCKEQLVINAELTHQAKIKQSSLHYAYIDYQKTFNSVLHSWLIQILQIYKVDPKLIVSGYSNEELEHYTQHPDKYRQRHITSDEEYIKETL